MPPYRPRKSAQTLGFEKLLNDPQCSPLTAPAVYRQVVNASNQSLASTLKYLGSNGKKPKEPSDKEKSKARIDCLAEKSAV